jgi:WD40 repeat protein/serine/threonine protein kinase
LAGKIGDDEQAELASHLESCSDCRARLEAMSGVDASPPEIGEALADEGHTGHVPDLVARLKAERGKRTRAADQSTTAETGIALNFLTRSDSSHYLGLLGEYEVIEVIGRGGMGVVLKAHDPRLDRIVAIKVLSPELAANAVAKQRFQREAQSAAAVVNDHVVTIHAVDEVNGVPFIVMEYVVGVTLADRIERSGQLKLNEILRIGMQAATGLAAAHSQGLVHRDVKPGNILLENGVERVKLTDFGLVLALDDVRITQTDVISGTPQYMSPEQARGEGLDHRSDLFSLGCVLYAMSTGRSPFRAKTAVAAIKRVCDDAPRPVHEINPEIPDWLSDLIECLLQKDPNDRIQSAREVAEMLGGYLAHLQRPGNFSMPAAVRKVSRRLAHGRSNISPWLIGCVAVCTVLILGVSLYSVFKNGDKDLLVPPEGYHFVSLRAKANKGLGESPNPSGAESQVFSDLETGILYVGQVPFLIEDRYIFLSGEGIVDHPDRVTEIPVGYTAAKLHFLHATKHSPVNCAPVAKYAVHYQDGDVETIDVLGIRHINDWNGVNSNVLLTRTSQAAIGWTGSVKAEHIPRLYHYTWQNPHPKKQIVSIDFERGPLSKPAPLCMAITCDDDPTPVPESGLLWAKLPEEFTLNLEGPRSFNLAHQQNVLDLPPGNYKATVLKGGEVVRQGTVSVAAGEVTWFDGGEWMVRVQEPSPEPAQQFVVQVKCIHSIATSKESDVLLCTAGDGTIALFRRGANGYQHVKTSHTLNSNWHMFAALTPNGRQLVTGDGGGKVRLWNAETLEEIDTLRDDPESHVRSVAVAPNGKTLAIGDTKGRVEIWDLASKEKIGDFVAHAREVGALAFSPDGRLLATGEWQWLRKNDNEWVDTENTDESYLKVWDPETHELKWKLPGHWDSVRSVVFSPDGQMFASASDDGSVRVWSAEDGRQIKVLFGFDALYDVAFSPDGTKLAAGAECGIVQVWDVETGRLLHDFSAHWDRVSQIEFAGERSLVTGSYDNTLRVWDLEVLPEAEPGTEDAPGPTDVIRFATRQGLCVSVSDDGRRLAAIDVGAAMGSVWDRQTHRRVAKIYPKFPLGEGLMLLGTMSYVPGGSILTRSSGPTCVRQYDSHLEKNDIMRQDGVGNFAVSVDGRYAAVADWKKKRIDLLELQLGTIRKGPAFPALGAPWQPGFSPDGTRIAVPTQKGRVVIIETETLNVVDTLEHDTERATICCFSPKGDALLAAGESVKLWDPDTKELIGELEGPSHTVYAATFSPDGQFIVTAGGAVPWEDKLRQFAGEICVWARATRELVLKLPAHEFGATSLAFTSDGKSLFTTGCDGKVCEWDFAEILKFSDANGLVLAE